MFYGGVLVIIGPYRRLRARRWKMGGVKTFEFHSLEVHPHPRGKKGSDQLAQKQPMCKLNGLVLHASCQGLLIL